MHDLKDKLIVALDVDSISEAERFVDMLYPTVKMFKVGSQLFTACGPEVVKMIGKKGARVFLDLKFHDIPHTVFLSVGTGTALNYEILPDIKREVKDVIQLAVFMMTVHTDGGPEMLKAAVEGAREKANELKIKRPYIVGVTVLTSKSEDKDTQKTVLERARIAKEAGLDGIVCAVTEASMIRKEFGEKFLIVTPGIRPDNKASDDQKRTATVEKAIKSGSNFLVIGRPILKAQDPLLALQKILKLSDK